MEEEEGWERFVAGFEVVDVYRVVDGEIVVGWDVGHVEGICLMDCCVRCLYWLFESRYLVSLRSEHIDAARRW